MKRRSFFGGIMAALCAPMALFKANRPRRLSLPDKDNVAEQMMKVIQKAMDERDDKVRARCVEIVLKLRNQVTHG